MHYSWIAAKKIHSSGEESTSEGLNWYEKDLDDFDSDQEEGKDTGEMFVKSWSTSVFNDNRSYPWLCSWHGVHVLDSYDFWKGFKWNCNEKKGKKMTSGTINKNSI